tara:strand:+ start:2342 stop:3589 length:1248 start_codon:yes stop_codon:yes gene_type:complete
MSGDLPTSKSDGRNWFSQAIRGATQPVDRNANSVNYKLKVLTTPVAVPGGSAAFVPGGDNEGGNRFQFRAMIIEDSNGLNPHLCLADPCNVDDFPEELETSQQKADFVMQIHQEAVHCIAPEGFDASVQEGDEIWAILPPSIDFSSPNLSQPVLIEGLARRAGIEAVADVGCASIRGMMQGWENGQLSNSDYMYRGSGGSAVGRSSSRLSGGSIDIGVQILDQLRQSSYFRDFNLALLVGLAANAVHESAGNPAAAGDAATALIGTPASNNNRISVDGSWKCSFGYWQLNVCGRNSGGVQFADYHDFDTSTVTWNSREYVLIDADSQDVYDAITNLDKQFDYVAYKMRSLFPEATGGASDEPHSVYQAEFYGEKVAVRFEICQHCMPIGSRDGGRTDSSTRERAELAVAIYNRVS